jgi:hypothetical protein
MTDKEVRVAIEGWLEAKRSPLFGYADYTWVLARLYGISGSLIVAIAQAETQCGTDPAQNPNNLPGHNVWGYGWSAGVGHSYMFPTWPDAISSFAKHLSARYVYNGYDTVAEMAPIYTGNTNPVDWVKNVSTVMTGFGGDPNKLQRTPLMILPPPQ